MKLEHPIDFNDGTILEEICPNEYGVYFIYRLPNVKRGIKGKSRAKVDEVLIVGMPWSKAEKFLSSIGIQIMRS